MAQNKIQPWHYSAEDQITDYAQKLTTLSNFNSSTNLKKHKIKRDIFQELSKVKHDPILTSESANVTLKNFNKTNRSEYLRRITKLVFDEGNKKYKFQPELVKARTRLKTTIKPRKQKQQVKQRHNSSKLQIKKSQKQIYYNLTQISILNNKTKKCYTEQQTQQQSPKAKLINKIIQTRSNLKLPVFRQLSVQRKIYIIQSGIKSTKNIQKQKILQTSIKQKKKRKKNIIQQICRAQRQYSKEQNKLGQAKM